MEEVMSDGGDLAWKKYGLMKEIWPGMEEVRADGGDLAWK